MKIVKLDRRYAGFPKWNYMIQFPKTRRRGAFQNDYFRYHRAFLSIYGPDSTLNTDRAVGDWSEPFWIRNENWHADFEKQRILFKDQAVMSMIMLKMPG